MTDEQIIQLFSDGKREKAFGKLYGQWSKTYQLVRQHGGNRDDAKDIFQETLIILYNKLASQDFKLTGSLNGFIYQTSRHLSLKKLQKDALVNVSPLGVGMDVDFIDDDIDFHNQSNLAEKALESLAEKCREILHFFYLEKRSMEWIATYLGLKSEQAAKTQKYKCLETARNTYQQLFGKEDVL